MGEILRQNLFSPVALRSPSASSPKLIRSEFSLAQRTSTPPCRCTCSSRSAIKGGVELGHGGASAIAWPAAATLLIGWLTPITAYVTLSGWAGSHLRQRRASRRHYGSVSAVTYIAAQSS